VFFEHMYLVHHAATIQLLDAEHGADGELGEVTERPATPLRQTVSGRTLGRSADQTLLDPIAVHRSLVA